MQLGGNPVQVELTTDLTRYDSRCTAGQKGMTIPNHKCGLYGSFDHFVAVRFDNGAVMDIAYNSLNILTESDNKTSKSE
jgi:hypothetical protein